LQLPDRVKRFYTPKFSCVFSKRRFGSNAAPRLRDATGAASSRCAAGEECLPVAEHGQRQALKV
jgi:hypothetical protein